MNIKKCIILLIASVSILFLNADIYSKGPEYVPLKQDSIRYKQICIPVLMYHKVNSSSKVGGLGLRVPVKEFEWEINYLSKNGYHGVSMSDIYNSWEKGEKLPSKPIAITFDDGYEDNYTNAYPILKKYHFKATIFVVANTVGGINLFDVMQPINKMLNWAQIKELSSNGIEIGSHTLNHPHLASIKLERVKEELELSKKDLEDKIKKPVEILCYPYGSFNSEVENIASSAGYKMALTTRQGIISPSDNFFALKRIRIMGMYDHDKFIREITKYFNKRH
jgi:peptidoglycan/xylan/chitin deacetylase (PgdA/CDA1 family)